VRIVIRWETQVYSPAFVLVLLIAAAIIVSYFIEDRPWYLKVPTHCCFSIQIASWVMTWIVNPGLVAANPALTGREPPEGSITTMY
jgi:hypothetical protein